MEKGANDIILNHIQLQSITGKTASIDHSSPERVNKLNIRTPGYFTCQPESARSGQEVRFFQLDTQNGLLSGSKCVLDYLFITEEKAFGELFEDLFLTQLNPRMDFLFID